MWRSQRPKRNSIISLIRNSKEGRGTMGD
ncbi:BnaCnng25570D [Brassica napus]|uniref:BnaCnng25570D protein n=1 Tax=Brassica napus TaxID=3708 RepID=A0A078IRS8_BRANA|nr:BnaCnng25570D [Brassica napus]